VDELLVGGAFADRLARRVDGRPVARVGGVRLVGRESGLGGEGEPVDYQS